MGSVRDQARLQSLQDHQHAPLSGGRRQAPICDRGATRGSAQGDQISRNVSTLPLNLVFQ
jgi:hypothetical protein